ncbi:Cell division protein sepF [Thalassoporum mexicanum PCC 7367]|uniref:cell division protein SepF n=1 Tax=Thalassoporum mexicanum TaxID=3457544 RepID=UPI00029FDD59|nr:cell division protein SepF [Pseudanabaena sp. PCC 7367]AFY70041.1 Cell division protein sepF [Pseudanabaena sp. PCC 7367]
MGIFTKLRDFVGLNEPQDYEYEYDEADVDDYQSIYEDENPAVTAEEEIAPTPRRSRERHSALRSSTTETMNNVIGMPGASNGISQVMLMEPRNFEEMPQAIQALRERKSVVLNLTMMEPDQAQRAVDFVAGGTYAIDGHQERIGDSIFLFAPSCVQVTTQSGVTVEPPVPQARPSARPSAPAPAWASEPTVSRFAQ